MTCLDFPGALLRKKSPSGERIGKSSDVAKNDKLRLALTRFPPPSRSLTSCNYPALSRPTVWPFGLAVTMCCLALGSQSHLETNVVNLRLRFWFEIANDQYLINISIQIIIQFAKAQAMLHDLLPRPQLQTRPANVWEVGKRLLLQATVKPVHRHSQEVKHNQ